MRSLHIGLNAVDASSYGAAYELTACEADAADMRALAESRGSEATTLLTGEATCDAVLGAMKRAGEDLDPGDLYFLTYSGHGGQVPDLDGDEKDFLDETWCLFDSQLRDDDINTGLASFAPGVRILMLSDSCHSGTVSRGIAETRDLRLGSGGPARPKRLPLQATIREFQDHENQYRSRPGAPQSAVRATGALISGCRDDQESQDGDVNGAFTAALLTVWGGGTFSGDHRQLHEAVATTLSDRQFVQVPNLQSISSDDVTYDQFLSQRPLTV